MVDSHTLYIIGGGVAVTLVIIGVGSVYRQYDTAKTHREICRPTHKHKPT